MKAYPYETLGVMLDMSRNAVMSVEALKKYFIYLQKMGYNCVMLYTEDSFENVGLLLEALSRDSHESVVDVYKETMLKSKYSRDENSAEMLDIIFASAVYDMGLSVFPTDTYYRYMEIFMRGKDTFASTTKSMEKVINMQLERLTKAG